MSHSNEYVHKAGEEVFEGDECVIMGWGGTKEGGQVGHFQFEWSWMTMMGSTILQVNINLGWLGTKMPVSSSLSLSFEQTNTIQREDHLRKVRVPVQQPESCTRWFGILFE